MSNLYRTGQVPVSIGLDSGQVISGILTLDGSGADALDLHAIDNRSMGSVVVELDPANPDNAAGVLELQAAVAKPKSDVTTGYQSRWLRVLMKTHHAADGQKADMTPVTIVAVAASDNEDARIWGTELRQRWEDGSEGHGATLLLGSETVGTEVPESPEHPRHKNGITFDGNAKDGEGGLSAAIWIKAGAGAKNILWVRPGDIERVIKVFGCGGIDNFGSPYSLKGQDLIATPSASAAHNTFPLEGSIDWLKSLVPRWCRWQRRESSPAMDGPPAEHREIDGVDMYAPVGFIPRIVDVLQQLLGRLETLESSRRIARVERRISELERRRERAHEDSD